jgi:pimeloyl-ACP methyl ester carboxylesterase
MPLEPPSMFSKPLPDTLKVRDAVIEYVRLGSGPPLLYLHGCDGVEVDDPFVALLARQFEVVAPSLPGFGSSDMPPSLRCMDDLAHFGIELVDALGLRDCILVGSSFGGWLAAEMATKRTGRFSRLVLAAPLGARFTKNPAEVELRDIFVLPHKDYPYAFINDRKKADAAFAGSDFPSMPEGAALRYCRNREAMVLFGWSPLLANRGLKDRLHMIDVPTLILWGDGDQVAPLDYGQNYCSLIPGAKLEIVADTGHYIPLESPAMFADAINAFIAKAGFVRPRNGATR